MQDREEFELLVIAVVREGAHVFEMVVHISCDQALEEIGGTICGTNTKSRWWIRNELMAEENHKHGGCWGRSELFSCQS